MRRPNMLAYFVLSMLIMFFATSSAYTQSCDVEVILQKVDTGMYTYVLDSYGELHEGATILQPANIEEGAYEISVTHKSDNFYSIDGEDYYLKTTACYEYEYYADAILRVVNYRNISGGELTFK